MLKKSIKQLLAYYSYYLIMANIIVCILQFQIQQMFWKSTEKITHFNFKSTNLQNHWSILKQKKKNDQGLNLAIGFAVAVKFTSRFTNKCHGKNAVEQADINHNHHHNRTRLCNTTIKGGKTKGSGLNLLFYTCWLSLDLMLKLLIVPEGQWTWCLSLKMPEESFKRAEESYEYCSPAEQERESRRESLRVICGFSGYASLFQLISL